MHLLTMILLLASLSRGVPTRPVADTTLTVRGFMQQDPSSGAWVVVVPLPVDALGFRTFVLQVQGGGDRWSPYLSHYVEVTGRVSVTAAGGPSRLGISVEHLKDTEPLGTVRRTVSHGFYLQGVVAAAVIPQRFAWVDPQGNETGVNPFVYYTFTERQGTVQESPIFAMLPTNDLLCVRVTKKQGAWAWDSSTHVLSATSRGLVLDRSGIFRNGMQLPRAAATTRGHYTVRVGICQLAEYDVTVTFDVQ